jgi:cysteine-rich repeat protein
MEASGPRILFPTMQSGEITDPDNADRCLFYPAIHPDAEGNAVVVMSGVGSSIYGSAFYTARSAFDPEGTMRSVAFLREGEASYVQIDSLGRNRWGDYGGIAEDPSTGEIWIFHEYAAPLSQGPNQWNTWFGRLATAGGVCGNGIVESWEECDDTGESAICDTDCTIAECGDGTLNTTAGEECDDGNLVALDGCEPDCTATQDQVLNGRKMVVRDKGGDSSKRKIVVLSRDFGVQVPPVESAGDPTIHSATFRIWNPNDPNKLETFPLPSSGWEALGSPPGSKGYQYRDPDYVNGPCKVVLLKTGKLFRAVCANRSDPPDPITFDLVDSPQEALAASLTLGAEFIDYCMEFGPSTNAEVRKDKPALPDQLGVFKAVNANPPGPCPSP